MSTGPSARARTPGAACLRVAAVLALVSLCVLPLGSPSAASSLELCRDSAAGDEAVVAFCRGVDKNQAGDKDGAFAEFQRAAALRPGMPEPHFMLGVAYSDRQEYRRAIDEYDQYLAAVPGNPFVWSNRGFAHFKLGDLAAARADIDRAAQLAPGERSVLENRIAVARESGDWPTVAADASRLLEQFPSDVTLRLERGKALANQEQFAAARDDFDRAVVLSPSASAYFFRGRANFELGDNDAAIYDFGKAIELEPAHADAYRRRAFAEYRQRRFLSAARDCGEFIRLRPDDGEGYYCRGIMLSRADDQEAAIADYRRAIELTASADTAGNAWYGIGLCHERAQRLAEAVEAYRRTVELYPDQAQARAALDRLTKSK